MVLKVIIYVVSILQVAYGGVVGELLVKNKQRVIRHDIVIALNQQLLGEVSYSLISKGFWVGAFKAEKNRFPFDSIKIVKASLLEMSDINMKHVLLSINIASDIELVQKFIEHVKVTNKPLNQTFSKNQINKMLSDFFERDPTYAALKSHFNKKGKQLTITSNQMFVKMNKNKRVSIYATEISFHIRGK